jgi:FKBP-type peptidyl-prolyl cis-trans isomerase 2
VFYGSAGRNMPQFANPEHELRFTATVLVLGALLLGACSSDADDTTSTTAAPEVTTSTATAPTTTSARGEARTPQDGDSVAVHYVGTLDDGSQFDSSRDRDEPFTFVVGSDQVIAGFDEAVRGIAVGDVVKVRIPPEEAYGERDEDLVFSVPIEDAPDDVAPGDEVLIGGVTPGLVTDVTETEVFIDANHRYAGQALTFEIELLSIE